MMLVTIFWVASLRADEVVTFLVVNLGQNISSPNPVVATIDLIALNQA